jgi:ATP-dependent protease HslVU (ClpYQ) peptidase subunit
MTTALAMICNDGIAIGTDMKVTAGGTKSKSEKLMVTAKLGKCPLVIAVAGRLRHIRDAIGWMELDKLNENLGEETDFDEFLDQIVEARLPRYALDHRDKYGEAPEIEMIIGCIDKDKKPYLVQIYEDGDYDYKENFAAIGSGSIFGEILLRKLHHSKLNLNTAQRLIGYIIWEIQEIDNESGEHMQIAQISSKGKLTRVDDIEIEAYKQLPRIITPSYHAIRERIENLELKPIKEQIQKLHIAVDQATLSKKQ